MMHIKGQYRQFSLILLGMNFIILLLQLSGIFHYISLNIGSISGLWVRTPVILFLICLGLIFYGMLNALKYKWFLMFQLASCLLAWTNVYITMMNNLI